jgi:hypothetical protein
MCGCGSGAILEALPTPLGSTAALFIPPAFAGPRAIPLIGTFPIAPEPASRGNPPIAPKPACPPPCPPRANEAAGGVKTVNNAIATFAKLLDMGHHYDSRERRSRETHLGAQPTDTTKLNFRFRRPRRCARSFRSGTRPRKCLPSTSWRRQTAGNGEAAKFKLRLLPKLGPMLPLGQPPKSQDEQTFSALPSTRH